MLNVSTALSTLSPRGTPAPGKIAGGDFKDTIDGLSAGAAADPLLALPAAIPAAPAVPLAIPAPLTTVALTAETPVAELSSTRQPVTAPSVAEPPIAELPITTPPIVQSPVAKLPVAILADPARPLACMIEPATRQTAGAPDLTISLLPALPLERQAFADDGKTLPADEPEDDPDRDIIWLPTAPTSSTPVPIARPLALPNGATIARAVVTASVPTPVVQLPDSSASAVPAPSVPASVASTDTAAAPVATSPAQAGAQHSDAVAPTLPSPAQTPAAAGVVAWTGAPTMPAKDAAPTVRLPDTAKPELPARFANIAPTTAQPSLPQQSQQPSPILPAAQVFAAAIAAVVRQGRDTREADETRTPLAIATAALDRLHTPAVAAPADARQAALDLRQDSGLQGMIDHIEVLRDGANAGDTRIRLVPDALGAVDVSVRRDGERVHVHFNAENQASARLIAEAQPRLAELADARGVKLGQTSIDSGDGQARRQQPATPIQFTRPAAAGDSTETLDDRRVA